MLNGKFPCPGRENTASRQLSLQNNFLKVGLNAGCCGLSRLANLMAKLDIEPDWLRADKSVCGEAVEITIGFGDDACAMERLALRLSGMVSLRYLERCCELDADGCERTLLNASCA